MQKDICVVPPLFNCRPRRDVLTTALLCTLLVFVTWKQKAYASDPTDPSSKNSRDEAQQPSSLNQSAAQYVYKEDLSRCIMLHRREMSESLRLKVKPSTGPHAAYPVIGRLSSTGEFYQGCDETQYLWLSAFGLPAFHRINILLTPNEEVYEYRSGLLIKGNLNDDYQFIPQLDSQITSFKDYQYKIGGIRIYNLPGQFERVQK
jgi:hypothetical protein